MAAGRRPITVRQASRCPTTWSRLSTPSRPQRRRSPPFRRRTVTQCCTGSRTRSALRREPGGSSSSWPCSRAAKPSTRNATSSHDDRPEARTPFFCAGGTRMTERYLEDYAVGQTFGSSTPLRMDAERIKAFAAEFDPQPFHLDEEAARGSIFQGLAASGWHTASVTMRLMVESDLKPAGGILGLGFEEFRWPRPVRPGDELRIESEVLEVRPSKSRSDQGLIKVRTTTLNQDGEAVQILVGNLLVRRRA